MWKKTLASLLGILLCTAHLLGDARISAQAMQGDPAPVPAAGLDSEVDRIASEYGVWGCSVAAFADEQIVYTHSWGTAANRDDADIPATDNTKYRIASISKLVSGILVMTLVEQDVVHLEDELYELIGEELYLSAFPDAQPTLLHLLTHTAGIYDNPTYKQIVEDSTPYPSLMALLEAESPYTGSRPGSAYNYSNLGMGLTAAVIENATGERFHAYAHRVLFERMGVEAGYLTDYIADKTTIAGLAALDPVEWGNMKGAYNAIPLGESYLLAQGEVYISAQDLARVVSILAGDGTYQGERYLQEDTVERINTVHFSNGTVTRGLGIQMVDDVVDGVPLYGHQGNAYGAYSCAFYDPLTKRGVVFLTNSASTSMASNQVYGVNNEIVRAVWAVFPDQDGEDGQGDE